VRLSRLLVVLLSLAGFAFASPLGFLGIGSMGVVNVMLISSDFTFDPAAVSAVCFGKPCNGDVNTATTLTFAGNPLLTSEGILINGGFPFGSPLPANAQIFNPFLQFAGHPNLKFILGGVRPGSTNTDCSGLATGQSCSIDENGTPSNVVLTANGDNTTVSLNLFGTAIDGVGPVSLWVGGFSATIPNTTPLAIAKYFCGDDASCTPFEILNSPTLTVRSVSGSFFAFENPVPEPNTTLLMGAGLILVGLTLRRFKVV